VCGFDRPTSKRLSRTDLSRHSELCGKGLDSEVRRSEERIGENVPMRIHKAGHEIRSVEDWFKYAPPKKGELQWEDKRSAKELAQAWCGKGFACPPEEMRLLLERSFRAEIVFGEAKPERVIRLDDFDGEHRNCDLVVLCDVGAKRMVVNVEAKADEPFSELIGKYYDQRAAPNPDGQPSRSNVPARIRELSLATFGREPDEAIRKLRYQLLHAAAATLIEAKDNGAEMGLLLVHEFHSASLNRNRLSQNATDWQNFVHAFPELATARIDENQILDPVSVPGRGLVPNSVPLFLGKLVTELQ